MTDEYVNLPRSQSFCTPCPIIFDARCLLSLLIPTATKLFVSNVEKQITQDELLQLFAGIGTVNSIELHFDKDGKSLVFSNCIKIIIPLILIDNYLLDNDGPSL